MTPPAPRVLLVDDMEDNLAALEAILRPLHLDLVRARSGAEAMKALLHGDFAVVLMDVVMPGMDGFETAAQVERLDLTRDVPIIFLTAYDRTPAYAFRGGPLASADYLTKPFDPWVLRAKVEVFVDLYRKSRESLGDAGDAPWRARRMAEVRECAGRLEAIVPRLEAGRASRAELAGAGAELAGLLRELRGALDALGCGAADPPPVPAPRPAPPPGAAPQPGDTGRRGDTTTRSG